MPRSSSYKTPNPNVSIQMTSTPNINCYPVPQTSSPIIPNIDSTSYAYAHNSNNIYRTTDNYNYWNYTETAQPPATLQTNFSLDTPFTESSTTGISNGNNNITWNNDTDEAEARERFWKWLDGIPD
ncbi:hypothetical protein CRE_12215 [Caenorhabditis remanei]|uniref:Uncharacterized protein n=1 Tax=Caenorhabditis remanei TaxID=31234 RepID=E3N0A8_CAERE|nr:hypothetical protein CRE_12215 [Caenorhabditis remanei]